MTEPCSHCGALHDGDCVAPPKSVAPAGEIAETCAYCGERHPANITCRQWARMTRGTATESWASTGLPALSDRPQFVIEPPKPKRQPKIPPGTVVRVLVGCLALVGAIQLVLLIGGRFIGGHGSSLASLPACSVDRIQQNLKAAQTIEAEGSAPLAQRVDGVNRLLLSSSADCSDPLLRAYISFVENETLCLEQPSSGACKERDLANTQLAQALNGS